VSHPSLAGPVRARGSRNTCHLSISTQPPIPPGPEAPITHYSYSSMNETNDAKNSLISDICNQHVGNNLIIGDFNLHINWSIHDLTTNDSSSRKFYEVKSDHSVLSITCDINIFNKTFGEQCNYYKGDYDNLCNFIDIVWTQSLSQCSDSEEMWLLFKDRLMDGVVQYVPKISNFMTGVSLLGDALCQLILELK